MEIRFLPTDSVLRNRPPCRSTHSLLPTSKIRVLPIPNSANRSSPSFKNSTILPPTTLLVLRRRCGKSVLSSPVNRATKRLARDHEFQTESAHIDGTRTPCRALHRLGLALA